MEDQSNFWGSRMIDIPLYINSRFFDTFWPSLILILIFSVFGFITYQLWVWRDRSRSEILNLMVRDKTIELAEDKQQLWNSYIKIESQNLEKNVLIQELNHRVKNNLQTISSLIGMQLMSIISDEARSALQETSRRIMAMSKVHEILYSSESISLIYSRNFFEVLTSFSLEIYDPNSSKIKFSANLIDIQLEVSTCIPLGMIITEAISNCMKHAFLRTENPAIQIDLNYAERLGWLSLSIKDNGCGIPDEFMKEKSGSMGMRLLQIFARQLETQIHIENKEGTNIKLEFKINTHENSNR